MIDAYGTLWSTGELNDLVMAIDPRSDKVERVDLGGSHIRSRSVTAPASVRDREAFCVMRRACVSTTATTPLVLNEARQTARCCSSGRQQGRGAHVIYTRTHALTQTLAIEGAPRETNQLRRVRASPLGRYVCASSHVDNFAALYVGALKQMVSSRRKRRWALASTATDGTSICAATTRRRRSSSSLLAATSPDNSRPPPAVSSSFPTSETAC